MAGVQRLDEWDPKRGRGGRPWARIKKLIYAREICWLCGKPVDYTVPARSPMAPSVDHRDPLSLGGHPTDLQGLELAHYGCNSRRGKGRPSATVYRPRSRDYG